MGEASIWHGAIVLIFIVLPIVLPIVLKLCGVGAKRIMMKNHVTGQLKSGFYGYSWTYLLFGFWVPLIRGELGVAALHLLFSLVTMGLWQLIVSFLYNKQYTNRLIEKGFRFSETLEKNQLAAASVGVDLAIHQGHAAQA
ncbi:hypothetical protein [Microvirga alba]|uniref:Uncharacterized protein n=1 Tax=Microvirga alba TaxID=2791025 RepID=A0A931BTF0_9HYPH|nr:hypothetical protein [Microvirga alba]MBF9234870.1 hypothetical protein [Microvirga alba]